MKKLKNTGLLIACFIPFLIFAQSLSTPQLDYLKTTNLYQRATAGDVDSMYRLALIYNYGDGKNYIYSSEDGRDIPVINLREAFYWLKKVSSSGHLDALYHFAMLNLEEAQGDFQLEELGANKQQGLLALKSAAQQGHVLAMSELHKFYLGENNMSEALYWEKQAAQGGHIPSQYSMSMGDFFSEDSNKQQKAVQWFLEFVYQDTGKFGTYVMGHIAEAYFRGIGITPDSIKAYAWQSLYVEYYPACQDTESFRQGLLAEYQEELSSEDIESALNLAQDIKREIETHSGTRLARLDFDCRD